MLGLLCICGTPNNGSGAVSGSFAYSWDPFPPTGLPCPILISEFVPNLYYILCYAWLKSLRGLLISEWKQRSSGFGGGGEITGSCGGRGNCSLDVLLCERRTNKKKTFKK